MIVSFTGTRKGMNYKQHVAFRRLIRRLKPTRFVHGNCIGADADAHRIVGGECPNTPRSIWPSTLADTQARTTREQRDTWHKAKPPLERNHDIVDEGEVLIVVPAGFREVIRSGTWAAVRYARKRGTRIIIIWPDGSVGED